MYGLILENIAKFIRDTYGEFQWQEIQYVANLDEPTFEIHEEYSEGLATRIALATSDTQHVSLDEIMESIGGTFFDFIKCYEYDKILKVLGRNFVEFLNGLDNLHEYIRFSYPKLKPPSFYCEHESKTGLTLHYRSKRHGFLHYVIGQVKTIAQILYETELKVEVVDKETDENMNQHVIMRLHFNNVDYNREQDRAIDDDLIHSIVNITSDVLFDIFPFIIVFNRGMRIKNVGMALLRVIPKVIGKKVNTEFIVIRPFVAFRWEQVMLHNNNVFEIMTIDPIFSDGKLYFHTGDLKEISENRRRMAPEDKLKFLSLRGQMMYMEEWESICFLAVPLMENLDQMYKSGLFLNDLALHDSSRDLVLAATQQKAEIRLLLDQEAQKKDKMEESMNKLAEEQDRTDKLLYQLLPKSVAEKLRRGVNMVETCETFDSVTVLFTDIVGFTSICSGIPPLSVVVFLNEIYSRFDQYTDVHAVFKVETIGDAYMIVGGAPDRTRHHAEQAVDCARSLVASVIDYTEKSSKKPVRVRAGCHSGACIAGVVGQKMPRYCLFGETVMIANYMESTGKSMQVQISDTTKDELDRNAKGAFQIVPHTDFNLKGYRTFKTYWITGKNKPPRNPKDPESDDEKI